MANFRQKINIDQLDIYVHTWYSDNYSSHLPIHNERPKYYQDLLEQASSSEYIYAIKPKLFLVEQYYKSDPLLRFKGYNFPSTITRMYSMFYGIQSVSRLPEMEKYDYIIRSRPDIYLEKKIDWVEIKSLLEENLMNVIIPDLYVNIGGLTEQWNENSKQYPDFLSIYSSKNPIYHDIYDRIQNFCGIHTNRNNEEYGNFPSIPEDYLAAYIKYNNSFVKKIEIKMMLARHHKQAINNQPIL